MPTTATKPRRPRRARNPQRTKHRAARRLQARTARIESALTVQPPRDYYHPAELENAIGLHLRRAAAALRSMGWRRIVRSFDGQRVTVWLPPGSRLPLRPVGRPRIYEPEPHEVLLGLI